MLVNGTPYRTVWLDGHTVKMIERRLLPHRFEILDCPSSSSTARAIKEMAVRGAGAIGAAAGYAMAQGVLEAREASWRNDVDRAADAIRATRPTAQDLFYAVGEVRGAALAESRLAAARDAAVRRACELADENAAACERIGEAGVSLLNPGMRVLTHCNAGWLAFVDWGSALAPIYRAQRQGTKLFVYHTETRPRSQGAKLTDWELGQAGVDHVLIADTAAGSLFQRGEIDAVIVGADRIAANGDTANKIGTYTLAVLAQRHDVPFFVAAPRSTFDLATPDGRSIPIEARSEDEVLWVSGETVDGRLERVRITAGGSRAQNPAFDVTPAELIRAFITDAGVVQPRREAIDAFANVQTATVRGRHG